ncbi:hypothetical protein CHS0354_000218 [Potamilus streckersoni]|uniref:Inhibitor of apoptosis 2 n=1 Tax=Potamilus streckersoni TaxID=2493646 RepID=A0AAE0SIQ6_9BIVA|nr:hypothetical protein CHS0354_000218 [Potamilus streckersoni]
MYNIIKNRDTTFTLSTLWLETKHGVHIHVMKMFIKFTFHLFRLAVIVPHISCAVQGPSRVTSKNPGPWTESDHIRSPQYQAYSIRLSSFDRWSSDIRQSPEQVADAGFYYTGSAYYQGLQDVVRCFACDGGLKNWDPEDEPWVEHARWFPQCPFVKRVKGQEFIDLVRRMSEDIDEDEDAVVHSTFQPNNPMAHSSTLRNELNTHPDEANAENVLDTDAAKCVLGAGYSKDIVGRTINELITKVVENRTRNYHSD